MLCVCRYWTDNGACYYYNTSSKYSDYEELLNAVKTDADQSGLPYRYMQVSNWQLPSSHTTSLASIFHHHNGPDIHVLLIVKCLLKMDKCQCAMMVG